MKISILFIEDSPEDVKLCLAELRNAGFEVRSETVEDGRGFPERLRTETYDAIISDYRLPTWNGGRAIEQLKQLKKDIPFILLTGSQGEEKAVECMRMGMADYILKDHMALVPAAVVRALDGHRQRDERKRAEAELVAAKQGGGARREAAAPSASRRHLAYKPARLKRCPRRPASICMPGEFCWSGVILSIACWSANH